MAKKKKDTTITTSKNEWVVVKYTDGIVAAIMFCDVNPNDERISIVSDHATLEDAQAARDKYGKENKKVTIQH